MAAKSQETKSSHGVKIDSTLIPTVSGSVNDELSGLGVSVYNQDDFEAGVLQQIDSEVQRRNAEQAKTFLMKEYNSVQSDIRTAQVELKNISKKIARLLSQPLSQVVLTLRELRASQEVKRKQIASLQAREQSLLRKLSGKDVSPEPPSVASSLRHSSEGETLSERERLIQTGQITPFDTHPITMTTSSSQPIHQSDSFTDPSSSTSTIQSINPTSRLTSITFDSLTGPSTSNSTLTWGVKPKKSSPTIQLSTNSFDGLFSEPASAKTARKGTGKSRKGKEKAKTSLPLSNSRQSKRKLSPSPSASVSSTHSSSVQNGCVNDVQAPTNSELTEGGCLTKESAHCSHTSGEVTTTDEAMIPNGEDMDTWMPTIEELENFDSEDSYTYESEYYTDDELGGPSQPKKKHVLRPLSSDDLDSEDEDHVSSRKRKKRCGSRRSKKYCGDSAEQRKHLDDGDEQLYRMRIREMSDKIGNGSEEDMVFEGGLRVPGSIWNKLYRYQQTGVKWLWELHCQQAGGIVGDEMGLGKTIQMISFLAGLQISNLRSHTTRELGLGPCLVVCPATVMHQWVSEFHSWWAPFRVAILHETGTFSGEKRLLVDKIVNECGVLITTYAGIRIYQDLLLRHKWDYIVLDEGHKIRNPDAEITLACKQFPTPHRIILSGSPMQNNLRELWSLFDFVFPGKLGTLPVFLEQFSVPITMGGYANATEVQVQTAYRCACVLRDAINPYLLRRMKADVKVQLPDKNEQVLFCRLTDYQHEVYSDYLKGPEVERAMAGRKQVFSALMTLRKLCNHPDLVTNDYSEQVTPNGSKKDKKKEGQSLGDFDDEESQKSVNIKKLLSSSKTGEEVYGYHKRSGKMIVIHSLLRLWREQGHRVLLFSQSKMMLDILEMFVSREGYSYLRMDGGTQVAARQPLVKRFNEDSSIFVFLLTTRVGGLGVNLTGANRVILYDPDWNPSTDTQARERAWRIGQTRDVTVYRLLTSGTIEEKIYHRQIFKQFLTNRVLKDPRQRRFFKSNDVYDLFTLDASRDGSTETSAIFAGTGSEITMKKSKKRAYSGIEQDMPSKKANKNKKKAVRKLSSSDSPKQSVSETVSAVAVEQEQSATPESLTDQKEVSTSPKKTFLNNSVTQNENTESLKQGSLESNLIKSQSPLTVAGPLTSAAAALDDGNVVRKKAKKKKKHKRRRRERPLVDGRVVEGVEDSCVYQPGSEDEESSQQQDDFILKKLFKKTGVHSAMKHDVIMNSADPDYVLVETEANKVAQSAVRAMKASRRLCQATSRWGRPTWTGNSGVAGAPGLSRPRFGDNSGGSGDKAKTQKHFAGDEAGTTLSQSSLKGSLHTSSSLLLAKMRSRNAHTAITDNTNDLNREVTASGIHHLKHTELLQEMRDFIATQCRVDGQATTVEILGKFSPRLPRGDTALFRSLLREICDFSRHLGDGLWSLKPEFR